MVLELHLLRWSSAAPGVEKNGSTRPLTFENFGSVAAVFLAISAAASSVVVPIAAFAAGASAQAAGSCFHWPSLALAVGAPAPVFAGAFVAPVVAAQRAYLALADISCPVLGFLCLKCQSVLAAECR